MSSSEYLKGLALLAWVSAEVVTLTGSGILLGYGLHRWMGAPMILALPLGLLGLAAAFWRIYRAYKTLEDQR